METNALQMDTVAAAARLRWGHARVAGSVCPMHALMESCFFLLICLVTGSFEKKPGGRSCRC